MFFQDCDAGFPIRYRYDGKIFDLRRLQAKCKVQTDVLEELFHTDDLAKNAKKTETKMQGVVDRMSKACGNLNLTISTKKTGNTPASTWKAAQRTNHHCEWSKTASCRLIHQFWEGLFPVQCTLMMRLLPEL